MSSTQVLLDSASVVKELIDNAIDAHATSIMIEISANTLDFIQVRDSGHGIAPEDREMVGKRFCTSKIRGLEDLSVLGGTWLGFRGEALNSLLNVAATVEITTRVEGENMGIKVEVAPDGSRGPRATVSHPIGTTVRATNFFHNVPVRRQRAEKDMSKGVQKIRKLLQAYVLSHPKIRFSFKVLKAKTDKPNFTYAPKSSGGSVEDAVLKLFGKDCANQCIWVVKELDGFEFHAFLPKSDCESERVSGIGQHLSIDSRPISTSRRMPKEITALFVKTLKNHSSAFEKAREPILVMNIVCPPGSYDPNVEPLKDDVLFSDKAALVACIDRFFQSVYPTKSTTILSPVRDSSPVHSTVPTTTAAELPKKSETDMSQLSPYTNALTTSKAIPRPVDIEEIAAVDGRTPEYQSRKEAPYSLDVSTPLSGIDEEMPLGHRGISREWRETMDAWDEVDCSDPPVSGHRSLSRDADEMRQANADIQISNPWTFAKMNARVRRATPQIELDTVESMAGGFEPSQLTSSRMRNSGAQFTPLNADSVFPSPVSSQNTGYDVTQSNRRILRRRQDLPTPSTSSPPEGTNIAGIQETRTRRLERKVGGVMKPFVPPLRSNRHQFGSENSHARLRPRQQTDGDNGDIRELFDNHHSRRKKRRGDVPADTNRMNHNASQDTQDTAPHRLAHSSLSRDGDDVSQQQACAQEDTTDIDASIIQYFTSPNCPKRQRNDTGPRRSRSSMLPLNHVPEDAMMHNMTQLVHVTCKDIAESFWKLDFNANYKPYETFIERGPEGDITTWSTEMKGDWSSQLAKCLESKYPDEEPIGILEVQLQNALGCCERLEL